MKTPPPPRPPTTASPETPPLDPVLVRLSHAARQLADEAAASVLPPARWGRLQETRVRRARHARARAIGMALALPLLVVAVWGARRWLPGGPAVDYRIEGAAAVGEGGYIHDVGTSGARLRFSDGSAVELRAGARAWVVERGPRGARLRLESGRARFDVVHRPGARWSVDAGPFSIQVTGTAFDVSWAGGEEDLVVHLWRGSVEVRGPQIGRGFVLRPGQRLVAHVRAKKIDLDDGAAEEVASSPATALAAGDRDATAPAPTAAAPAPTAAAPASTAAAPAPGASEGAPARLARPSSPALARSRAAHDKRASDAVAGAAAARARWPQRVAAGDFASVLEEAQATGVDGCVSACALDALAALADAARYSGRDALARRLLLAERDRFPGSPPAHAAAFLLGRMADEGSAGLTAGARSPAAVAAAVEWYDRYLDEAPGGVYASEALARKMLAVGTLGDHARARRLAEDYLRRYPGGAYAPQATALTRRP